MRSHYLPTPVAPGPVFLQIARGVADDVRRGRLRPGERLPGSRVLAASLGVHRNTVLAALRELEDQGWVRAEPARGVFVRAEVPRPAERAEAHPAGAPGYPLAEPPAPLPTTPRTQGVLWMAGGQPDLRLLPLPELARAYRRALRLGGRRLLDYGDPRGEPRLRAALAGWLAEARGLALGADDLVVTRGSQQALALLADVLVRPGDRVAVEALGYRPAWAALRRAGAELVPIPVDAEGIDVAALTAAHAAAPLRAVYVTPHHQYPTGVLLGASRREALLALARAGRFAVLEDDYDNEFHYRGRPVLPLASADRGGVVVYVGTFSKAFAPGIRLGFVHAPRQVLDRLAAARHVADRQGDRVVEIAVAELLEEGALVRHVRKAQQVYRRRRDVLLDALATTFGDRLRCDPPAGGMALWCATDRDATAWAKAALAEGVGVQPGAEFTFGGGPSDHLRLGFACLDEGEIREAIRRLARAEAVICRGASERRSPSSPRSSTEDTSGGRPGSR